MGRGRGVQVKPPAVSSPVLWDLESGAHTLMQRQRRGHQHQASGHHFLTAYNAGSILVLIFIIVLLNLEMGYCLLYM